MREQHEMNYQDRQISLSTALDELQGEQIAALMVSSPRSPEGFLLIMAPNFGGDSLSLWTLISEQAIDFSPEYITTLRNSPGICFVAISVDESLDLATMSSVNSVNFPWDDWRLIYARVKRQDGTWDERKGPAYDPGHTSL
jgi:hypothetical protein